MAEVKVKTAEEYNKQFCKMMNEDGALIKFTNVRLSTFIVDAARDILVAQKTQNVEAGTKVVGDTTGKIMSFIAFLYAKAREKEDEMNNK